ncbi:MAG TPA: TPM domain-containing protein [Vicinamibacterales bacterium]|nr:TPM domain-containing protein [Vicinamibacterales bacterium]
MALALGQAVLHAAFPPRQGHVNDFAGVLDSDAQLTLQTRLREAERQTRADIVLVTVKSLDGLTAGAYANELFRAWGIGRGQDRGILVLVAPATQRIHITVSRGLEPILPDVLVDQVIRTAFVPSFKKGDYRDGLLQGIQRVVDLVRRHHVLTPAERQRLAETAGGTPPAWMLPLFGLLMAAGAFAVGIGSRTKTVAPVLWGSIFGGTPLGLGLVLFSPSALVVLLPPGIAMFAWGFVLGGRPKWHGLLRGSVGDGALQGGWVMGGTGRAAGATDRPSGGAASGAVPGKGRATRRR